LKHRSANLCSDADDFSLLRQLDAISAFRSPAAARTKIATGDYELRPGLVPHDMAWIEHLKAMGQTSVIAVAGTLSLPALADLPVVPA
jgi:hypothetical protein